MQTTTKPRDLSQEIPLTHLQVGIAQDAPVPAARAGEPPEPPRVRRVHITPAWQQFSIEISAFWPAHRHDRHRPEIADRRACLCASAGSFTLHLDPTVADLRALAAMLTALADERDGSTVEHA